MVETEQIEECKPWKVADDWWIRDKKGKPIGPFPDEEEATAINALIRGRDSYLRTIMTIRSTYDKRVETAKIALEAELEKAKVEIYRKHRLAYIACAELVDDLTGWGRLPKYLKDKLKAARAALTAVIEIKGKLPPTQSPKKSS